jgi:hypothetical protein
MTQAALNNTILGRGGRQLRQFWKRSKKEVEMGHHFSGVLCEVVGKSLVSVDGNVDARD